MSKRVIKFNVVKLNRHINQKASKTTIFKVIKKLKDHKLPHIFPQGIYLQSHYALKFAYLFLNNFYALLTTLPAFFMLEIIVRIQLQFFAFPASWTCFTAPVWRHSFLCCNCTNIMVVKMALQKRGLQTDLQTKQRIAFQGQRSTFHLSGTKSRNLHEVVRLCYIS